MSLKQIDNQKLINKYYQPLNEDDKRVLKMLFPNYDYELNNN